MATLLGDGGDLDSMDRSLLDCELSAERFFKISQTGNEADIVSLDPTKLSLSCCGSLARLKIASPPPPPPPIFSPPHTVSSVTPNGSSRAPLGEAKTINERKIVKFSGDCQTMVLPPQSVRSDRNIPEQGSSVKTQGEQSFVYFSCRLHHFSE